ncbi:MAG: hypothetical protein WBN18_03225 [Flavobacteriaceae bacterium]
MKTCFKLLFLSSLMFFISCSTESVSEDLTTDLTATAAKAKKPRPIKNTYVGIDRFEGGVLVGADFTGNMSHAGNITGYTTTTSFVFNDEFTGGTQTSDDVIVAANGDEIYTSSKVTVTFSQESIDDGTFSSGTYTGGFDFVGGNGRFEGATGRSEIVDFGVFGNGMAQHKAAGSITY